MLEKLIRDIRNNFIFVAAKAIDKKINGREIGKKLDEEMDKQLGKKSEKIQRGSITNLLLEILEGLWEEDLNAFKAYLKRRY